MTFRAMNDVLNQASVFDKIKNISNAVEASFKGFSEVVPLSPARDVEHRHPLDMPAKDGFASLSGQLRLLHDLASIELQAMELGLRTLIEFPGAPSGFREELAKLTLSEADHLQMLLCELADHGGQWGMFPVHTGLWNATDASDTLLDRITIVHRHLEGSGLDAGSQIIQKLAPLKIQGINSALKKINDEEVGHVEFGSRWYRQLCLQEGLDPNLDFADRMIRLGKKLPLRSEKINKHLRIQAGFTELEIEFLEKRRLDWLHGKQAKKQSSSETL